ncbi:hypothetical protein M569_07391 [Genlisea aurea]|uniref:BHLH domain-containing protein n=1 Tax=Genlisea aurea TaxID=192259 RepID=S8CJP8_9LAMI|nr:hypothetical protein M569_07391 [Genlisea aurea]
MDDRWKKRQEEAAAKRSSDDSTSLRFGRILKNAADAGGRSSSTGKRKSEGNLIKERLRREQMSQNFFVLQSMLPSLPKNVKIAKEKIANEAVNYIKYLQGEASRLESKKAQFEEATMAEAVAMRRCGNSSSKSSSPPLVRVFIPRTARFFAVECPNRPGTVTHILKVFENHEAEVLEARISVDDRRELLTFTSTLLLLPTDDAPATLDRLRNEILLLRI